MERQELEVTPAEVGLRLDRYLAEKGVAESRSVVQREIRAGRVLIDGVVVKQPSRRLREGERVRWEREEKPLLAPRVIPLAILYEDDTLIVVDKPPGLVVHPGAGRQGTTLVEGLLLERSLPQGEDPVRPGIVHRLDKETSGLVVVAKTDLCLRSLKVQFAERGVTKVYLAQVEGPIEEDEGAIDAPIGRDPTRPRRMAVQPHGRPAQTEFRVLERDDERTLLLVCPLTGRTHQIRVHLRYIGHPVVGDSLYGKRMEGRLLLHAWRIELTHPASGRRVRFEAPIPAEFPTYPYHAIPWPQARCAGSQAPQGS